MDGNGVEVVENCEKAERSGRFFASVFTRQPALQHDHVKSAVLNASSVLECILLPEHLVERELQNLKEAKPSGPADLSANFFKELASELSNPLAHIFNSSFE
ncbi:unnamed protein product [Schistocephalus solidus]|uniref:Uncharacterized protein n=1 Tax=Schistocephalus solidus TaxID=70667 RepID=A0A183T1W1_SCHSO|nr:unnamed protein product [Schistocephalus solidus]